MAQFIEVMRQAKRMCSVHGGICSYRCCPLANGETCRLNVELDGEDYNELERIIMDWAAKHPEPVYPSCDECVERPMPAVGAEPVRHGKWIKASGMLPPEYHNKKHCSVCGNFALHDRLGREQPSNYCPNCGAKIEGV